MKIEKSVEGGILVSVATAGECCFDGMYTYVKFPFTDVTQFYPSSAGHFIEYNEDKNVVEVRFSSAGVVKEDCTNLIKLYEGKGVITSFELDEEGTLIVPDKGLTIFDVFKEYNKYILQESETPDLNTLEAKEEVRKETRQLLWRMDNYYIRECACGCAYRLLQAHARTL